MPLTSLGLKDCHSLFRQKLVTGVFISLFQPMLGKRETKIIWEKIAPFCVAKIANWLGCVGKTEVSVALPHQLLKFETPLFYSLCVTPSAPFAVKSVRCAFFFLFLGVEFNKNIVSVIYSAQRQRVPEPDPLPG